MVQIPGLKVYFQQKFLCTFLKSEGNAVEFFLEDNHVSWVSLKRKLLGFQSRKKVKKPAVIWRYVPNEMNDLRKLLTYFQMSLHVHSNSGYACALSIKICAFSCVVFMEDVLCPFSFGVWHTGENIPPFPFLLGALLNYSTDWWVLLFIWFFLSLHCCAFTKGLIWVRCHSWRLCFIFLSSLNTLKWLRTPVSQTSYDT